MLVHYFKLNSICIENLKTGEIGVGNPQWPNAYAAIKNPITLKSTTGIVSYCYFTSTGVDSDTNTSKLIQRINMSFERLVIF